MSIEHYKSQGLKQIDKIDAKLLQNQYINLVYSKVPPQFQKQVHPSYIAAALVVFTSSFLIYGFGAAFVTNLIGFIYPLYASFASLQNRTEAGGKQQEKYLTYWIIFGCFSLVESATDFLLYWIPFYHLSKCAALVWLYLPQTNGAQYLYKSVIEPVLVRYESTIDSSSARAGKVAQEVASDVGDEIQASISGQASSSANASLKQASQKSKQMMDNVVQSLTDKAADVQSNLDNSNNTSSSLSSSSSISNNTNPVSGTGSKKLS